jgi:hypothetical protein
MMESVRFDSIATVLVYQCLDHSEEVLAKFTVLKLPPDVDEMDKLTFMVTSMLRTSPVSSASEKSIFAFHSWVRKANLNCRAVNLLSIS